MKTLTATLLAYLCVGNTDVRLVNKYRRSALWSVFPILLATLMSGCVGQGEERVILSVRGISDMPDSWHDEAIASGSETFGDEGCIVNISAVESEGLLKAIRAALLTPMRLDASSFSAVLRLTYHDGTYVAVGDYPIFKDESGEYYRMGKGWPNVLRMAQALVLERGCRTLQPH